MKKKRFRPLLRYPFIHEPFLAPLFCYWPSLPRTLAALTLAGNFEWREASVVGWCVLFFGSLIFVNWLILLPVSVWVKRPPYRSWLLQHTQRLFSVCERWTLLLHRTTVLGCLLRLLCVDVFYQICRAKMSGTPAPVFYFHSHLRLIDWNAMSFLST